MADVKRPSSPPAAAAGSAYQVARPHGANAVRRRAPAAPRPSSARAAGAGGSSNTMMKLYTDSGDAGLKVDPFVVIVLALSFIASIFFLHIAAKVVRALSGN
ncbi:Arf guanine nucleotide exchange factor sbh1 [Apiotrichum porosum]|uniref:Protein transport protein Sec61 subunit beta n=1 Tax=Apiotrichum porosum TaxID=105984 RepID=A0A427XK73_9TREE|nr:Arf guanine nucleotide exchange factor sbh1 [Apiotrichum porosum]RSH79228.1 Arf guanine nucleotide exchange factor sbh1 [Apiotrichum porosum]